MANFIYHRPSDRITAGTWSISTGTARTGYPLTALDDADPSAPFWANETTIRIVKDLGSALRVDRVYIFAHNFVNAAGLRLQMHTANSWGAPDVNIPITIPTPYEDGFAYHLTVDVATAYPTVGDRTKRYLSIVNTSANTLTCAIGEVWIVASNRQLTRNVRWGMTQPRHRMTAKSTSKRGVASVYDYGTIERSFSAQIPATPSDYNDLRSLEADARGNSLPFPVIISPNDSTARLAEPMYVRFAQSVTEAPLQFTNYVPVTFALEELGRGEIVGA